MISFDSIPKRSGARTASYVVGFVALLAEFAICERARADSRMLVVGLTAPSGAFDVSMLDAALIDQVRLADRLDVAGNTETVSGLRRELRCAALDDACLELVATRRSVDRVIFGDVATSADDADHLTVSLRVFDLYTRSTREVVTGTIEADHLDSEHSTRGLAEKLVSLVARIPEEGTATVRAIPGSTVLLDDRTMDVVPANGQLVLRPLRVGRRALRVVRPNHSIWEAPIVVRTRESIQVTVDAGASLASFDQAAAESHPTTSHAAATGSIRPPPDYILAIPGVTPTPTQTDVIHEGQGLHHVGFHIPIIEEHVATGGEIRTTTHARVGFLPNVSSSGARVTAKLHF